MKRIALALLVVLALASVCEAGFLGRLAKRVRHPFGGCHNGSCR